jgi:hypothetical protein
MGMVIALIRLRARQMNGGINRTPVFVSQFLRESTDELSPTLSVELLRQNHHHFSTQLRIAAISTLHCIPKRGPILGPRDRSVSREPGRYEDFLINNIIAPQVRVRPIPALVTKPFSRAIRSRLYNAGPLPSRESLLFHHVDRHAAPFRIPLLPGVIGPGLDIGKRAPRMSVDKCSNRFFWRRSINTINIFGARFDPPKAHAPDD